MPIIKPLDQAVVNLIAAGEIIVAPVNALKELIENSVDAGSTMIDIQTMEGGLKMLQIQDNGCGIGEEDLELLCVRHTTSKLQVFEDLREIETYGFRGEALASISHIAHVKVTTKTRESARAFMAKYEGPKLIPPVEKRAGNPGTRITVEDLFYNVPNRRRAFRSGNDEFNKILEMVSRYAVHCSRVGFTLKKLDGKGSSKMPISLPTDMGILQRISALFGAATSKELFEFQTADKRYDFKASGWSSNANFSLKKMNLLLFINNRSVESSNIKKALDQTYAAFLPKGGHPWIYLSILISPRNVDVNVHPTKREVNFIAEDEIIQCICEEIRSKMTAVDSSRTFFTQTLLPGANAQGSTPSTGAKTPVSNRKGTSRNDSTLIRTDANARKITSMLPTLDPSSPAAAHGERQQQQHGRPEFSHQPVYENDPSAEEKPVKLSSILELRHEVRAKMHDEGTELIGTHTFVGILCDNKRIGVVQSGRKLYMVDYHRMSLDLFYQIGLTNFGNFGTIKLSPPLTLKPLLQKAARHEKAMDPAICHDDAYDAAEVARVVECRLMERREMIQEYFGVEVTPTGELKALPLLLKGYSPSLARLPYFLLRLGPHVEWMVEKGCFETFLWELAKFHAPEKLPPEEKKNNGDGDVEMGEADAGGEDPTKAGLKAAMDSRRRHLRYAIEHVIFPAFKDRLLVLNETMQAGITEVADLKALYRTFERC
ncbi:hypothetical protein MKZ38_005319 [Zalerion maritima]|uniref:DNA mismatch repair protein S5 domain-containing protein n=1 Tax=Zalerion maritima TaxID=339359 RepID=A0AAD5RK62_9PEZI|nr:hypothetical protein MKZ38_005319 [Zalerion maritima]